MALLYNNVRDSFILLNQDVSHGFDVLGPIIRCVTTSGIVSTCVGIIHSPCCSKPNSGITAYAVTFIVTKDTDSCFGGRTAVGTHSVKAFLVTVGLQGSLGTNQCLPRVTTQWRSAVFSVSDQRVQGAGLFLDENKLDLLANLHTETDLGEGCVPVGRQLGLLSVKSCLASWDVIGIFVAPKPWVVMEGFLKGNKKEGKL